MKHTLRITAGLLLSSVFAVVQTSDADEFVPVEPAVSLGSEALRLRVSKAGKMQIDSGRDSYTVESCFSYPGVDIRKPDGTVDWQSGKIGWNGFPGPFSPHDNYPDVAQQLGNEPTWSPVLKKKSSNTLTVQAEGRCYRLVRTVRLADGRVDIEDRFTNKRAVPTAIVPRHMLTANQEILDRFHVYGLEVPANPTLFLPGVRSSLGLVMQDNVSRRRYRFQFPEGKQGGFQINRCVLDVGKSHTFSWSIYVLQEGQGYFDFVNRIRSDWNVQVTVHGPYMFGYLNPVGDDVQFHMIQSDKVFSLNRIKNDPGEMRKFREYLEWRGLKVLSIAPWLDYDPGAMDHVVTRDEYRKLMAQCLPTIRKASPGLKIIGCVETPYVSFNDARGLLPQLKPGDSTISLQEELTPEQVRAVEEALGDMAGSLIRDEKGRPLVELYIRGGKAIAPAARVYPEMGNARHKLLMEQARFLIEEVGLDGVYFDMFALGQIGSFRNYGKGWDGMSAEIDFSTGEWQTPYVDCALVSVPAKLTVLNYLLSRNKVVFANRHSTSREEQTLQVNRFTETGGDIKLDWPVGEKPPLLKYLCFSHLSTPLGFGLPSHPESENPTRWLMRGLITYLRHGMVFCQGDTGPKEPPMTEDNKDAFAVVKQMYPITPLELGEGFIVGKERILTTVSMNRLWKSARKPSVTILDVDARRIDPSTRCTISQENGQWRVELSLSNWAEIAVIE